MNRKIKLFTTAIMTAFFLFIAFASGNKKKEINIDSIEEIKEFISGKWHDETVESGGVITYYRFEITSQEIKCWKNIKFLDGSGTGLVGDDNWEEQPTVSLSIGSVQTEPESNRSYEKKYRQLGDCSYGKYMIVNNAEFGTSIDFTDNNSVNSNTEWNLERGWEF
jgi:hypothetical protein